MRFFVFLSLIFSGFFSIGQQISGYVSDAETGEVLIGAYVYSHNTQKFTSTNTHGFFSLQTHDKDTIIVSYVGYNNAKFCTKRINNPLQIKMQTSTLIDEITVKGNSSVQKKAEMGLIEIPIQQLKTMPALAGESDIMKTLQLMPGVKTVGEGKSSLMVRGGSPDQNMVILDNVPLYYINHLGGFVSVFNTESLTHVSMQKGAFPARYGGRLSSIIDVHTKNGNLKEHHTSLSMGLVTSKVLFEGPIINDTLSYLFSARRFMYDLLTRPITYLVNDKNQMGYTFYDVNAKINYKYNRYNRFFLSFYSGRDKILSKQTDHSDEESIMRNATIWGNYTSSLRWNHIYGAKLFSNTTLYYLNYKYKSSFKYSYQENSSEYNSNSVLNSGINDFGLNMDFEYYLSQNFNLKFGTNHISHVYKPNNYEYTQGSVNEDERINTFYNNKYAAFENSFYVENEGAFLNNLSYNIGYRISTFTTKNRNYFNHEPRAVLNLNFSRLGSLRFSYARMSQYVHLLTYFGASLPADLWVPSTNEVPPQVSHIYSTGFFKEISEWGVVFSIEAYYKKLHQLIEFKAGYNIFASPGDWCSAIEKNGNGNAKGIEIFLQRKSGRINGWLSYSLAKSIRQFENINNGKPYLYTYDATHNFSVVAVYELKDNLDLSATWTYMTGRAISLPNEYYISPILDLANNSLGTQTNVNSSPQVNYDNIVASYEEKNNVRMAPYHRLDIALKYKIHKKRSDRILSCGIYNLYCRQNAVYYYFGTKEIVDEMGNETGKYQRILYQRSLFPIIPSVSYTWIW